MFKKWLRRLGLSIALILLILSLAFFVYTSDYYRALPESQMIYDAAPTQGSRVHVFGSLDSKIGIIFYPGGKVEDAAYASFCDELSQTGVAVFLVDMPFNLAVFSINSADQIREDNPTIDTWYIAGHSLGGAMASSHQLSREGIYAGIIFLAAYPLESSLIPTLILKGSQDLVLDSDKLEGMDVHVIEGGNHAQFGSYGIQDKDGEATISPQAQRALTIELIDLFIHAQP